MTSADPIAAADGAVGAPPLAAPPPHPASSSALSSAPSSEVGGDEEWDDWAEEGQGWPGDAQVDVDTDAAASLFDPALRLPSVPAALAHDAAAHAFDLVTLRSALSLGDHGTFQLINWVRAEVGAGRDPRPAVAAVRAAGAGDTPRPWDDARWLVPTLPDDALLFYDYDDDEEEEGEGGGAAATARAPAPPSSDDAAALAAARTEAAALRAALAALAAASLPPEAAAALPPGVRAALEEAGWEGGEGGEPCATPTPLPPPPTTAAPPPAHPGASNVESVDRGYFGGYSGLGIHRTMLADTARTDTYRAALERNPSTIAGKVVLDVGCGTGVLSLFAARGGAAAVVGVEGAAPMAALARRIVAANGLLAGSGQGGEGGATTGAKCTTRSSGPVSILQARVEDLIAAGPLPLPPSTCSPSSSPPSPPPQRSVDVIVSEWMGYALFFECMLDSVLAARDAWLKPGGVLLPDRATVYVAGLAPAASDLDFWSDVAGLDLSAAGEAVAEGRRATGAVLPVDACHVVTAAAPVLDLDLMTAGPGDAEFSTPFCVAAVAPPPAGGGGGGAAPPPPPPSTVTIGAVALWFDVAFTARACPDAPQVLSTSPSAPQTHWHQAVLELDTPLELSVVGSGSGREGGTGRGGPSPTHLRGRVSMARGAEHRSVDISLECEACAGAGGPAVGARCVRLYTFAMSD